MKTNLSKILLAFFLIILLANISLAENNTEYNNEANTIFNETLNSSINLTIFELTGTITDKENNTKGNFSHYLIGFEFIENDNRTYTPIAGLMIITNSSGIFNYTYYISDNFIQTRYTNGTILNETYIYTNGKLLASVDNNNQKTYYHPDHLGSTTLVTNQTGDIIEEEFYLPYGDIYFGNEESRHLYTSKEKDKSTNLYYYGARYYNSLSRQFIQPDSLIADIYNPQNLNRYSYVLNNPYKYTDSSGNVPVLAVAAYYAAVTAPVWVPALYQYSIYELNEASDAFANHPSVGSAFWLGLATYDVSTPGIPEGKIAKAGEEIVDKARLLKKNRLIGLEGETKVLEELSVSKNTKTFTAVDPKTGELSRTIPDIATPQGRGITEIKNTQSVSLTKQLRTQDALAKSSGEKAKLFTGTLTKISQNVKERFDIVRKNFLGPRK